MYLSHSSLLLLVIFILDKSVVRSEVVESGLALGMAPVDGLGIATGLGTGLGIGLGTGLETGLGTAGGAPKAGKSCCPNES